MCTHRLDCVEIRYDRPGCPERDGPFKLGNQRPRTLEALVDWTSRILVDGERLRRIQQLDRVVHQVEIGERELKGKHLQTCGGEGVGRSFGLRAWDRLQRGGREEEVHRGQRRQ